MKSSTSVCLVLVFFLVLGFEADVGYGGLFDVLADLERVVRKGVVKPVERVLKEVVEKPVRSILEAVGIKRVRKTYKQFKQEAIHARVIFTEGSYRVEKVTPCAAGQHDIVKAQQRTEIHFDDNVVVIQDRYSRKCGEHFYSEPKKEL